MTHCTPRTILIGALACALLAATAAAQESASFKLREHTFNAGGHPESGTTMASGGFRISLDAIAGAPPAWLASDSFRMDLGLCPAYRPPGEVGLLRFTDGETLVWGSEPSAGTYNLYRATLGTLTGLDFGECWRPGLTEPTANDAEQPAGSDGFFYLATVANLLLEEGTKGFTSAHAERLGSVCP